VTPDECRVACHWEYSRETHHAWGAAGRLVPGGKAGAANDGRNTPNREYCPHIYHAAARELFPQAWTTLTKEQRAKVLASFYPVPKLQVRRLVDFLKRIEWAKDAGEHLAKPYLLDAYVIQPKFSLYGVEAIIKEFETWARKEAKNHHQAPRAKAAEPPFDALKWLAVKRLDAERRKARINFEATQEAICEYRRKNPQRDPNDVFPIYASHGAWSKALADSSKCYMKVISNASHLLAGLV